MERHGVEKVILRNQFYWENYRMLGITLVLLLTFLLFLTGFVFYQRLAWPKPKYFATTPDGRPLPIIPLNLPLYEDSNVVMKWATDAVYDIYSFDYVIWRKALQDIAVYFTPKGYENFLMAIKTSNNLEAIKNKKQVVNADIKEPTKVSRQGQLNENVPYSWDLEIPMKVTYQNSEDEIITQEGLVIMRVERASLLRYKEGLAISQMVFQTQ